MAKNDSVRVVSDPDRPPTSAAELLRLLEESGRLEVTDPPRAVRAAWRRVIYALITGTELPEGRCIRHSGRDKGDLIIRLVDVEESPPASKPEPIAVPETLSNCHQIVRATLEAAKKDRGPIDNRGQAGLVHLRIHKSNVGRALLIIQGLINEAERRGYAIGTHKSHRCQGGLGIEINGHSFEVSIKEETRQIDHVFTAEEQRRKDRDQYVYAPRYDFEWTGRLQLQRDHETYTAPLATDRIRWRLEDRLPHALEKLETFAAEAEERRKAEERRRLREQQAWEAAMVKAREDFVVQFRRTWIRKQVAAHQEAEDLRKFASDARPQATAECIDWLDWAVSYAERLDPLRRQLTPPVVPEPQPDDLTPFLGGWSPYGPTPKSWIH